MIDDILSLERRGFLQQTAGVVALAAVSAGSEAAVLSAKPRVLALYQEQDPLSVAFAAALREQGIAVLALGTDVVRLWRDQLHEKVIRQNFRLIGMTPYADYFVLKGLAAEERVFTRYETRQALTQMHAPGALQAHVVEVLTRLDQRDVFNAELSTSHEASVFSWII